MSSDGLWADQNLRGGLASSRAAVEFARARLQENGNDLSVTTDALVQEAVKAAESDNTTAILVSFQDVEQVVALASNHCRDALPACPTFGPQFLFYPHARPLVFGSFSTRMPNLWSSVPSLPIPINVSTLASCLCDQVSLLKPKSLRARTSCIQVRLFLSESTKSRAGGCASQGSCVQGNQDPFCAPEVHKRPL